MLSGLSGLTANLAQAATPPERVLPDSTVFLVKVNDVNALREAFRQSQYGQLWNDPALKDFREDLSAKLKDASNTLKDKIGVTLKELFEIPQGRLAIAAVASMTPSYPSRWRSSPTPARTPEKMVEVMNRSTKQAEEAQAKVSTEAFQGGTLHIIQPPASKDKKEDDAKPEAPRPPLAWTNSGSLFYIASNVERRQGPGHSRRRPQHGLAGQSVDSFAKTQAKIGSGDAPDPLVP